MSRKSCAAAELNVQTAESECRFDDRNGFDGYQLDCGFCRTPLTGIVDPTDEALLLSVKAPTPLFTVEGRLSSR